MKFYIKTTNTPKTPLTTREKKRKRRNHRKNSEYLLKNGGFMSNFSAPGSTFWWVARWHKKNARNG